MRRAGVRDLPVRVGRWKRTRTGWEIRRGADVIAEIATDGTGVSRFRLLSLPWSMVQIDVVTAKRAAEKAILTWVMASAEERSRTLALAKQHTAGHKVAVHRASTAPRGITSG